MYYHVVGLMLVLLSLRTISTWFSDWRYRKSHGLVLARSVPQLERVIGIGWLRHLLRNAAERLSLQAHLESTKENGPTTSLVLLCQTIISTSDPENIKAVLATKFKHFDLGERSDAFKPFLGRGIFTADGAHWERSRALIRPNFTKALVAELSTVEEHVRNLISKIPKDGSTVDLQPLFFNLTLDSATHFLFGRSIGFQLSSAGSEAEKFSTSFDRAQEHLQTRALLGKLRVLLRNKQFEEDCRFVHSFVDQFVEDMLSKKTDRVGAAWKRYNLMGELADATDDRLQLRNELLNVLLAARDTTASLLSSIFFMLARHEAVWIQLQAEVARLDNQRPSYEDIREMGYIRAVLNETLRLFPPVPTNIRYANSHTSLPRGGGVDGSLPIFIAKGTGVHYSSWTMHRSPSIYGPDAEDFRPGRWLEEGTNKPLRPGWGFLAFSGGPRICIGQQKALTEAAYVVIRLMQEFGRIENRDSRPWREHMGLVMSNYHGTKIALYKW